MKQKNETNSFKIDNPHQRRNKKAKYAQSYKSSRNNKVEKKQRAAHSVQCTSKTGENRMKMWKILERALSA